MTNGSGLRGLFAPSSIALVGATDKSGWSRSTFDNLCTHGFAGPVHLVNPRTEVVHGKPAVRALADIGEPVDLAYVMVPTPAVLPVLEQGVAAGIRNYVVLTAGFGETGPDGREREARIAEFAEHHGLTVLGPNGNGYINAAAGITPYGLPIPPPLINGSVGVVLQSGGLASAILSFARARNVGISLLTSMGNEMMVSVTDVIEHLVDDPATKVIALFLESIRHPERFAAVARRAAVAGKPIVALKVGASQVASRAAQAHTGALVGDDAVIEAAFRQLGIIRVRALEDLIITAGLLADVGTVPGPRLGVVTASGGASEIIADRAETEGLDVPEFAPETVARLKELLPDFATPQNPVDVTGYVLIDRLLLSRAMAVVAEDPNIDAVLLLSDPPKIAPADPNLIRQVMAANVAQIRKARKPVLVVSNTLTDITEYARELLEESEYPYVAGGIEHAMTAIGAVVRWSAAARAGTRWPPEPAPVPPRVVLPAEPAGVWAEHQAAKLLADNGIPVVPATLASTEEEAVAAAEAFGYPVVVKAVADGLGHKSDIGAVRLGLTGPDEVRAAHRELCAALRERELTGIGTLVQPHRFGGLELLVGVVRDPAWQLTLAVGLGGVWVEVLRDVALRVLPVDDGQVAEALDELRGAALFRGVRGDEPVDVPAVAAVVTRIARLAEVLGPRLESLEVNPLLVRGARVEALDALVTWH